jgi:hypothetical protein
MNILKYFDDYAASLSAAIRPEGGFENGSKTIIVLTAGQPLTREEGFRQGSPGRT